MRLRVPVARAVALAGLLAAGSVSVAGAAPPETFRIGVGAVYPTYSIFYAAKELGYYSQAGLDVQIETFRGGPAGQEALAAGAVDACSIVPTAASLAIGKGIKEHIVADFSPATPQGWYIMVPSASPVKSLADLNGKTVGVTQKGSLTDFWVQSVAKSAHITVTTVPLGGGVEAGLKAKQVDAAILWPMFSYKAIIDGDLRPVADLSKILPPSVSEGVAVTDDFIAKHPDEVRRFLGATSRALAYMQSHEAWSIDFLKRYFDDSDARAMKLVYDNFILKTRADGTMQPQWMKDALALGSSDGVATGAAPDQVFSTAFTPIRAGR